MSSYKKKTSAFNSKTLRSFSTSKPRFKPRFQINPTYNYPIGGYYGSLTPVANVGLRSFFYNNPQTTKALNTTN